MVFFLFALYLIQISIVYLTSNEFSSDTFFKALLGKLTIIADVIIRIAPTVAAVTTGGTVLESLRSTTAYTAYLRLRKIIWTGTIKPSDVLYIRIKSVMENTSTQCVMDWMELVPKNVYNGAEQEDKW